ncbi:MAG TPA: hypothetical protein VGC66_17785 [Pyrinomonadaceae bacterium]|jgi:hypothetical protein
MMVTTPENILEAKRALKEFMTHGRDVAPVRPLDPQRVFLSEGDLSIAPNSEDEPGRTIAEAKESARRYCQSRNRGSQPHAIVEKSLSDEQREAIEQARAYAAKVNARYRRTHQKER